MIKRIDVPVRRLVVSSDLTRSSRSKVFEERLEASIDQIGLAEPLKVAAMTNGKYLIVDGVMRWRAISAIRAKNRARFDTVPAYLVDHRRRFEVRYQTDIYQDLLPSQLATLVEHLHKTENIKKGDIGRYIGVSPPTVRNYTGVYRLLQRRGLFARLVELMDVGVVPSSNPYAWLRLNAEGLRFVIEHHLSKGERAETWVDQQVRLARQGAVTAFPLKYVEAITDGLPAEYYREDREVRAKKKDLGYRRAAGHTPQKVQDTAEALRNLSFVIRTTSSPVLKTAAQSLQHHLR